MCIYSNSLKETTISMRHKKDVVLLFPFLYAKDEDLKFFWQISFFFSTNTNLQTIFHDT